MKPDPSWFPFDLYAAGALGCGLITALSLPLWRAWCVRTGLVDDPGRRKIHHQPIPLAGGLAVFTGLALPLLLGVIAALAGWLGPVTLPPLSHGLSRRGLQIIAILSGAGGMLLLGWLDDRHEWPAFWKLAGQVLIAGMVAAAGVRITLFVPSTAFSVAATVLWIVSVTNAVNILDNMNGLCAGLGVIASACLGTIAAASGHYLVALLAFSASGALLGFLPFNFPRASTFLGDAGSHLVGFLLAVLAILPHFFSATQPRRWAVLAPLLILAVPLGDLAWVIGIRRRLGQPIHVGDNNHLSHRLVRRGLSRERAVLVIWLMAALSGALGVWLATGAHLSFFQIVSSS